MCTMDRVWRRSGTSTRQVVMFAETSGRVLETQKVSLPGADAIWLNFRNNATQPKLPAEITIELAQELEKTPSQYWFNVASVLR